MSAPVEPGQVLANKYRIERVLGEGGMGVVVAAVDMQLDRRVAVKFLLPAYALHPDATTRFLREARAAVKIHSEHVARVIDVGTLETGAPFMVMEHLEGADLTHVLSERGALPIDEAVGYVLEACEAIAEAHSYGIVHRDLKPANLFLARQPDGSSKIKVLDFGISKALVSTNSGIDAALTRTSSMMGSPLYMSPEQMKNAKDVDPRTDIWALGIILHELLSGDTPFVAQTVPELSAKVLLEEPVKLSTVRPDVPLGLQAIIERALAKDPNGRFPTVAELALGLAEFAPAHGRSVERITRVLRAAGLSSSQYDAGRKVAIDATVAATQAQTAAAWSESGARQALPKSSGLPIWLGLGAAGVAAAVGGFLVFAGPDVPASGGVSAASSTTPTIVQGVPSQASPPSEPSNTVPEESVPADDDARKRESPSAGDPVGSARPTASAKPAPVVQPRVQKRADPAPRTPTKRSAAPAPSPTVRSTDVEAFGNRK